jgi:hypothetical protein
MTGVYVTYPFAPGAISAGFSAIPAPATLALIGELFQRPREWQDMRISVISLAISFLAVTIVHFPFARATRRRRETDRQFDAERRQKA